MADIDVAHAADVTYVRDVTYTSNVTCGQGGLLGHFSLSVSLSHKRNLLLPSAPVQKIAACSWGHMIPIILFDTISNTGAVFLLCMQQYISCSTTSGPNILVSQILFSLQIYGSILLRKIDSLASYIGKFIYLETLSDRIRSMLFHWGSRCFALSNVSFQNSSILDMSGIKGMAFMHWTCALNRQAKEQSYEVTSVV